MKLFVQILVAICLLSSCEKTITEFQSRNFIKFFGSGTESKGNDVIIADSSESSYLFVGYDKVGGKNKIMAVKTDKYGNTIWENIYESDSIQEGTLVRKIDGDFIIAGTTQFNTGDFINPKLVKISRYGDIIWNKVINHNYNLLINDVLITGNNIIVAGESYATGSSQCYFACIDTDGTLKWEYSYPGAETYRKVFLGNNGKLILIGNSSITTNLIKIFEANLNGGAPVGMMEQYPENKQIIRDAVYRNEDGVLYLLVNDQSTTSNTLKIFKYTNFSSDWESKDPPQNYTGKSLTLIDDGSIFITSDYNNEICFAKVDNDGDSYFGNAGFKNYPGNAGKIISTPDNGLLIVGATASTFGTMVQLIKTDKDLYLLKP